MSHGVKKGTIFFFFLWWVITMKYGLALNLVFFCLSLLSSGITGSYWVWVCGHVCGCVCSDRYVRARGQLCGVSPLLLACRVWGLNLDNQAWQQVLWPIEPSHWLTGEILWTLSCSLPMSQRQNGVVMVHEIQLVFEVFSESKPHLPSMTYNGIFEYHTKENHKDNISIR